jgi:transposase
MLFACYKNSLVHQHYLYNTTLLAGQTDPQTVAALAKGKLRQKTEQLQKALAGTLQPYQRVVVIELLSQMDYLEEAVARLEA